MNIPDDAIQNAAKAAADSGKGPDACPYLPGSDARRTWEDVFYTRLARLLQPFTRIA